MLSAASGMSRSTESAPTDFSDPSEATMAATRSETRSMLAGGPDDGRGAAAAPATWTAGRARARTSARSTPSSSEFLSSTRPPATSASASSHGLHRLRTGSAAGRANSPAAVEGPSSRVLAAHLAFLDDGDDEMVVVMTDRTEYLSGSPCAQTNPARGWGRTTSTTGVLVASTARPSAT